MINQGKLLYQLEQPMFDVNSSYHAIIPYVVLE